MDGEGLGGISQVEDWRRMGSSWRTLNEAGFYFGAATGREWGAGTEGEWRVLWVELIGCVVP